ncbi:MAG: O-antigen ligase family protein [Bacteroidetes bacterium]|nr:O-antigen ligase family protein [Bacteroidota bacterium]
MPTKKTINRNDIYLFGLILLAIGIPLSNVLMSVSQIILFANWLFDKNILKKIKTFFYNKPALIFSLIFLLHLIGLLYTSDFNYAFKDLRTKIPILLLPLLISTSPLIDEKKFRLVLSFFVGSVLFASIVCYSVYLKQEYEDIRQISIFISHIRFSLNICLAICILFYFVYKEYISIQKRWIIIASILWLIYFLFILQSATGIIILFLFFLMFLVYSIICLKKRVYKLFILLILVALPVSLFIFIKTTIHSYFNVENKNITSLEKFTPRGNLYYHDTINSGVENGNYIGLYVCPDELKQSWEERSMINIDSNDRIGQRLSNTLIRFLNSKGLRKDADGVKALTDLEIKAIEKGCANIIYLLHPGLQARLYNVLFEYESYKISRNTRGHSIFQRFELWRAAVGIIKNNFWFGVGTGDMVVVYENQLKEMKSDLAGEKLRAHNQYLSIFSAFGIVGFIVFLLALISPALLNHSFRDFYFLSFFIILCLSMINEDTIESQAGVTFFAFFYSFLLLSREIDSKQ